VEGKRKGQGKRERGKREKMEGREEMGKGRRRQEGRGPTTQLKFLAALLPL